MHELQEVVAGELRGRETDADVVLFKSNGLAAWDVAIGPRRSSWRARGVGGALQPRKTGIRLRGLRSRKDP